MADLESDLRALGRTIAFPPTPEVASSVAARLRKPRRRFAHLPRPVAIALAALAIAIGPALAVPPARTAILDLFHLGGVSVELVDDLPPVGSRGPLALGTEMTLPEARRRAGFRVSLPDVERYGEPDAVFFSPAVRGGRVSLLYGSPEDVRLLVTEFRGDTDAGLIKKAARGETTVDFVRIREAPGFWMHGAPHAVVFRDARGAFRDDRYRLAGNVLLWVERGVTYRVEGKLERDDALELAESFGE